MENATWVEALHMARDVEDIGIARLSGYLFALSPCAQRG
jgi:hypothetical protein